MVPALQDQDRAERRRSFGVYDKNVGIANRFNGTWSLLTKGHEGRLFHPRMIHPVVGAGPGLPETTSGFG